MALLKKYVNDILGSIVIAIALLALWGWFRDRTALVAVKDGWITMKPWTACCLVIAGVHCISRSVMYRTKCRATMLSVLGLSYACAVLLFMWELSFLLVTLFYSKQIPFIGERSTGTMIPSVLTIFSLFIYSLTGFCTRYSWSVASFLCFIGLESLMSYGFEIVHVGCPYVSFFEILSANSSVCFITLGTAIFISRTQRTHWFITECKAILKDL